MNLPKRYIELKYIDNDYGTEMTYRCNADCGMEDLYYAFKHFTLALGYSPKTVRDYFEEVVNEED